MEEKEFETKTLKMEKTVFEDKTYRLEEMVDAMEKSLENGRNVCKEQEQLISLINEYDKDKKFESFTNDFTKSIESSKESLEKLERRKTLLKEVVDACKVNDVAKETTNRLIYGLGVFPED